MSIPLFELLDVEKAFDVGARHAWLGREARSKRLKALDGVRLRIDTGDSIALVGESGSGKSTLIRVLLGLSRPTDGRALYRGRDLDALDGGQRRAFQRDVAMVYQDARGSLDPRMRVLDLVAEPIRHHGLRPEGEVAGRVAALLEQVGLPTDTLGRYASQLSGGQVRRVAVARALASEPVAMIADEAVSGLDVSTQAQLLNLLRELQRTLGLTLIFITHDLSVASYLCSRMAVMYLGRIVEAGPTRALLDRPAHPYTRALVRSAPRFFASLPEPLAGEIPSPVDLPEGCRFAGRCPEAASACRERDPTLETVTPGRSVACLRPLEA
ncbi:oligopeptide/dipeptide ABC transporter ATP-binding protein [Marinivivus vitaminiproducens]|uniref:oligopeptide/dipeptide ABC transporter ATP-binding protein n=1 Tax=Marinivivus vitaminiproducens TaxID=3035935 RepID=UPI00279F9FEE|nr:ABC transporter ATP-binding protein [Geminicoccaceae bacterium SCSIO 64248]